VTPDLIYYKMFKVNGSKVVVTTLHNVSLYQHKIVTFHEQIYRLTEFKLCETYSGA